MKLESFKKIIVVYVDSNILKKIKAPKLGASACLQVQSMRDNKPIVYNFLGIEV